MKKIRIGIYGGTFNPPHIGHIRAAEAFIKKANLDKLLIIPTGTPPHKEFNDITTPEQRLKMCQLAFGDIEKAEVSDMEILRGGKSYTYQTLRELANEERALYFLCGEDMLLTLDEWRHPEKIFALAQICYIRREIDSETAELIDKKIDFLSEKYKSEIININADITVISSSEIRRLIKSKLNASEHLSKDVYKYISDMGLYQ